MSGPIVNPPGAVSTPGVNINVDFDQSGGGTGSRIPQAPIDGTPHDVAGNASPLSWPCVRNRERPAARGLPAR